MNRALVLWFILISSSPITHGYYNPIPVGCVIVSSTTHVKILQPLEYGGNDGLTTIYTAVNVTTIVTTIYDPTARNIHVLYTNTAGDGTIYLSQLIAREQLSSTVYQLPVSANISYINQLISFTADVSNNRAFLTNENGTITMFSMSGLMKTTINTPANVSGTIRSVMYNDQLNRLFSITDNTLYSCTNLEANQLTCCSASAAFTALRSVAFDATDSDSFVYVMDRSTGVYRMALDAVGCPQSAGPISSVAPDPCIQLVVDQNIFFYSSSALSGNDNSYLVIGDQNQNTRKVAIQEPIIALHVSYPNRSPVGPTTETCFNGISYSDYRLAVVLAALFGTIMGIFMCFNALFCIDFFMTKRIIRGLKQQIPHNLLEDRWNKLVEEKYAKLALEKARKKDDPAPAPRRKSSFGARKMSSTPNAPSGASNQAATTDTGDSLQVPNPIPKLSAYLRRKSESYLNRRRSDDYRSQRQGNNNELTEDQAYAQRTQLGTPRVHIESVQEEHEPRRGLKQNLSRRELLEHDADFL